MIVRFSMAFKHLVAQRGVVELLQRSLERGRLGHAYLFTGTDLDELERVAATLAKTLNCVKPVRASSGAAIDCCDACENCRRVDTANHPDVQWVRAESKSRIIAIDQIRDLLQSIYLKPTLGGYKVAVLVAADRLKTEAANAFLKTLEEPPERTVFVLLTTDVTRILETILSRCLRLNFAAPDSIKLKPEEAEWLARFANEAAADKPGLFGRYKLLDAMLSRLSALKEQVDKTVSDASPLNRGDIKDVEPGLRKKWEEELDAGIEAEYRRRRGEALGLLHWWLRDVWLVSAHSAEDFMTFPQLAEPTRRIAARLQPADAMENLRLLDKTQQTLHTNAQEALTLEVGFLRLKL